MAEADEQVGVLIPDVDAAGIGVHPVDDGDLPVVPIVEVDPVHIAVDGVEHLHLHAGVLQGLEGGVGEAGQVAEVVKNDPHLHAGGGPLPQDREDAVPDLPLRQDVVLQEDVDLRLPQVVDQVVEERGALREVPGPGAAVEQEVPGLQIGGQPPPGGGPAAQRVTLALLSIRALSRSAGGGVLRRLKLLAWCVPPQRRKRIMPATGRASSRHIHTSL